MSLRDTMYTAFLQEKAFPMLYDLIFRKSHPLLGQLKAKMETFSGRQFRKLMEIADSVGQVKFTSKNERYTLQYTDIGTAAYYSPKMLTGTLLIPTEDELEMVDKENVILDTTRAKMANLQKSIEKACARRLWERATTASKEWNSVNDMIGTGTIGGIAPADLGNPNLWKSNVMDLSSGYTDDATDEQDLLNNQTDVYILKLLRKGFAKCKRIGNEKPTETYVPQYIYDLIESVYEDKKKETRPNETLLKMGFDSINYRGVYIIPEPDMVEAQVDGNSQRYSDGETGNTDNYDENGGLITASNATDKENLTKDGRMYFVNLQYLYMFFNEKAKFTVGDFQELEQVNAKACKVHAYGNLAITNRCSQTVVKKIRSPWDYER